MDALERVMHVEDDESIRTITKFALEEISGLQVDSFANGQEAIVGFDKGDPQVLLLDVMMPGLDGPTTLEKIRETHDLTGVLILFMTAKVQEKEIAQYRQMGALDVIIKPFDPMTLGETLKELWSKFIAL